MQHNEYADVIVHMADGNQYAGKLHLMTKSRVRDVLNDPEQFVALKDVTTGENVAKPYIIINKHHIVSISPAETADGSSRDSQRHPFGA